MLKNFTLIVSVTLAAVSAQAQLNVGSTSAPDASAMLQVSGTTKGFLPPVMNGGQRTSLVNPATGLVIYNLTLNEMEVNTGTPAAPVWTSASAIAAMNNPGTKLLLNGNLSLGVRVCPVNTGTAYTLTAADMTFSYFQTQNAAFATPLTLPAAGVVGQVIYIINEATSGLPVTISATNTDNTTAVVLSPSGTNGVHGAHYLWDGSRWIHIQ